MKPILALFKLFFSDQWCYGYLVLKYLGFGILVRPPSIGRLGARIGQHDKVDSDGNDLRLTSGGYFSLGGIGMI